MFGDDVCPQDRESNCGFGSVDESLQTINLMMLDPDELP